MADKLRTLFSFTGLRHEVLPGIRLAFLPVLALTVQYKEALLQLVGIPGANREVSDIIVAVTTVLGSVALWAWAGYLLDPLYDSLYGPSRPWTRSPGRKLLFFGSGYDLDKLRARSREKLAKENPTLYSDPNENIYKPILEKLKQGDADRYKAVQAELENSKAFRSAVLPVLALAVLFLVWRSWTPGLVTLLAFISVLELSFRYRANNALEAYRWFVTR